MNKLKRNSVSEDKMGAVKIYGHGVVNYALFNQLPTPVYCCDVNGKLTFYNTAAIKLWGTQPDENATWCGSFKLFNEDGEPISWAQHPMAKCVNAAVAIDGEEIILLCPNGDTKHVKVYPSPIFDDFGNVTGAISTLIEVTDQKKGDAKQAMLASIIASSDDAIISKTLKGIITSWNAGAKKIFGYTEAEVVGKHIEILIPLDRRAEEKEILAQLRKGNRIKHFETVRLTKEGKAIQISLTVSPIKDQKGKIIGASKIARDITQQKQIEEALIYHLGQLEILNAAGRVISEKLSVSEILQRLTDAITKITAADFGICYYNSFSNCGDGELIFAQSANASSDLMALTKADNAFFNPKHIHENIIRLADITQQSNYEPLAVNVASYLAVPIISKTENALGGLFFGQSKADMFTVAHEAIAANIASQAAAALDNAKLFEEVKSLSLKKDQFIARASHEIKTPLTSIQGYLQILEKEEREGRNKLFLDKALNQLGKLNTLVAALFDLSKITAGKLILDLQQLDLAQLLSDIIENYKVATDQTHHFVLKQNEGLKKVTADKQRIEQVIHNLLNNAIKYSPNANEIIVSIEKTNKEVMVHIQDYGMGISAAQQEQIFAQFYRAEGVSANISGLGVGLHISKEIIDCHNGRIWVESELGKGARFSFALPTTN